MTDELKGKIQARARELWEKEGKPTGQDIEHWIEAAFQVSTGTGGEDETQVGAREYNEARQLLPKAGR
jgi:hypothetical protein